MFWGGFWTILELFSVLFPFFLFAGILVSALLIHARNNFNLVYGVDLSSAAVGCLAAIVSGKWMSPVTAIYCVVGIASALSGALFSRGLGDRHLRTASLSVLALAIGLGQVVARSPGFSDPLGLDYLGRQRVASEWNAFSNVSAFPGTFYTWALSPRYAGPKRPMVDVVINGNGGTEVVQFNGDPNSLADYDYLDQDLTALGQSLVPSAGRELIIGPGGGVDILQAVRRGRKDVTAVEINPEMVHMVNHDLRSFSGAPYELPGVRIEVQNGRTFIKRTKEKWDLIDLTWVDAGGSAQAMALSENYLYTVEAYSEFFDHLTDNGMFAFMRALGAFAPDHTIDTLRGLSVVVEALRKRGITDAAAHVIVGSVNSPFFKRPMCYVLVKLAPFTADEVRATRDFFARNAFEPLSLPGGLLPGEPEGPLFRKFVRLIHDLLAGRDLDRIRREAWVDVAPATDDQPFYFIERGGPNRAEGKTLPRLRQCLGVLGALVAVFIGLPLVSSVRKREQFDASSAAAMGVFCLLGLAFMLVEIEMFQVFALLIGNPAYTMATVLGAMLIFSGLGSLLAKRLSRAPLIGLVLVFGGLTLLLAGFTLVKSVILGELVGLSFLARVVGTIAVVAPIAFLMGLPLATCMLLVGDRPAVLLWGWALNGAVSVLATVLAVYVAIHIGVSSTFVIGAGCYAGAGVLTLVVRSRREVLRPM